MRKRKHLSGGDPEALRTAKEGMSGATSDVEGVAGDVRSAYGTCAGSLGKARVDEALERFVAAYGGELTACSLSTETLGEAAVTNAELLDAVTGGNENGMEIARSVDDGRKMVRVESVSPAGLREAVVAVVDPGDRS